MERERGHRCAPGWAQGIARPTPQTPRLRPAHPAPSQRTRRPSRERNPDHGPQRPAGGGLSRAQYPQRLARARPGESARQPPIPHPARAAAAAPPRGRCALRCRRRRLRQPARESAAAATNARARQRGVAAGDETGGDGAGHARGGASSGYRAGRAPTHRRASRADAVFRRSEYGSVDVWSLGGVNRMGASGGRSVNGVSG
eukprot:scaffold22069_cov122-Isochrysis_galbana.AAC.4